jgi:hypothetical protein
MTIYILTEEGEFIAAFTSRIEAEKAASKFELNNWHIVETILRD